MHSTNSGRGVNDVILARPQYLLLDGCMYNDMKHNDNKFIEYNDYNFYKYIKSSPGGGPVSTMPVFFLPNQLLQKLLLLK